MSFKFDLGATSEAVNLFGGSFNPPHDGHREVAKEILNQTDSPVVLLPAGVQPLKGERGISAREVERMMDSAVEKWRSEIAGSDQRLF